MEQAGFACYPNDQLPPYRFFCNFDPEDSFRLTVGAIIPDVKRDSAADNRTVTLINYDTFLEHAEDSPVQMFHDSDCLGTSGRQFWYRLKGLTICLVTTLKIGGNGCYGRCSAQEKFFEDGSCEFCRGYCCRADGVDSYCSSLVMNQVSFPDRNRHYCLENGPYNAKNRSTPNVMIVFRCIKSGSGAIRLLQSLR